MQLTDDPRQRCVLLVDQFEEIFTQTKDEDEHAAYIKLLTTAARLTKGEPSLSSPCAPISSRTAPATPSCAP